ncbi:MAG: GAF domain-containing protein [Desulfobacteraceae bacterium]|nr:GAF domain-containing protein [Desulfobacteraceae bacterium]
MPGHNIILLIMGDRANRRLLHNQLEQDYQVRSFDPETAKTRNILQTEFDLLVLDGVALHRLWEMVRDRKDSEKTLFLPLLLVTGRNDVGYVTRNLWLIIDEIVLTPVEKNELSLRVEILIKARRLSLESEQRYITLAQTGIFGVAIVQNQKIAWCNTALTRMLDMETEDVLGRSPTWLIHDRDGGDLQDLLQDEEKNALSSNKALQINKSSRSCFAKLQTAGIRYLGQPARLLLFTDITELVQTMEKLRRTNRAYQILSQINKALIQTERENELLHKVCSVIVDDGEYSLAWVGYARQDADKSMEIMASAGEVSYLQGIFVSWARESEYGQGPVGQAVRDDRPIVFRNTQQDTDFAPWQNRAESAGLYSLLVLPLHLEGSVLGTLNIYSCQQDAFDQRETELLQELADDLAFGIQTLQVRNERRRVQERLEDSEHRFRSLFHNANDAVYIHDLEGNILEVNDPACRMTGFTREELLQMSL